MVYKCKCGAVITSGEICLYCKSKIKWCDYWTYKEMTIPVPWCEKKDDRIYQREILCEGCEDNKQKRKETD